jgi:hypothetical protein
MPHYWRRRYVLDHRAKPDCADQGVADLRLARADHSLPYASQHDLTLPLRAPNRLDLAGGALPGAIRDDILTLWMLIFLKQL